jgi:hypothetical protein
VLAAGVSLTPEAYIPLVGDDADPPSLNPLALSKSPKSCEFPVLAMVTNSMLLTKVGDAGKEAPAVSNVIEYITIATLGNSQDFGDLTVNRNQLGGVASPTRCCWAGGIDSPSLKNEIDYVQIMSTGNAIDFGDIQSNKRRNCPQGISNGHGGLG